METHQRFLSRGLIGSHLFVIVPVLCSKVYILPYIVCLQRAVLVLFVLRNSYTESAHFTLLLRLILKEFI